MMTDQERYTRAQKRVRALRSFYGGVVFFVVLNVFLLIINLITDPSNLWFYWPLLGSALIVTMSAISTFGFGTDWEERKVRQIMDQEKEFTPQQEPTFEREPTPVNR